MATSLAKAMTNVLGSGRGTNLAFSVQVYPKTGKLFWVTKSIIIRNPPITAFQPTARQAEWRATFARLASNWRGATGSGTLAYDSVSGKHKAGDMVLKVQEVAQKTLKGQAARLTNPPKTEKRRYAINSLEELEKIARGRAVAAPPAGR